MKRPSVALCIPLYNPPLRHVKQLIDGIGRQLRLPDEVVVSIDSCDERTVALFEESSLPNLTLQRSKGVPGMTQNWNRAVRLSTAEACLVLGQDDVLQPCAVAAMVGYLSDNPTSAFVGVGRQFIDDSGERLRVKRAVNDRSRVFRRGAGYRLPSIVARSLSVRFGNVLGEPSAVMFRRAAFEQVGAYSSELRHAADLDLNLKLAAASEDVGYLAVPLLARRLHSNSLTTENVASGVAHDERQRLLTAELEALRSQLPVSDFNRAWSGVLLYDVIRRRKSVPRPRLVSHERPVVSGVVSEAIRYGLTGDAGTARNLAPHEIDLPVFLREVVPIAHRRSE